MLLVFSACQSLMKMLRIQRVNSRNIFLCLIRFAGPGGEIRVGPEADFGQSLGKKQLIGRGVLSKWLIIHTQRDAAAVNG